MVAFCKKSKVDQQLTIMDWILSKSIQFRRRDAFWKQSNNAQTFDESNVTDDLDDFFDDLKELVQPHLHVNQAADQKKLCNRKVKEAHHEFMHGVAHSECQFCLVVDYCQNAQLPNLGATQPGNTYYVTPLTVEILGIVDCPLEGGSLDAFTYYEGIGGKGGDNIASMINKNNHVLCLANLLVEAGYFKKSLYTFKQLCKALGTNERITMHSVSDGDLKHYKWLEDLF
eukprot:jgi/Psemu1/33011/gm1.33011_g